MKREGRREKKTEGGEEERGKGEEGPRKRQGRKIYWIYINKRREF